MTTITSSLVVHSRIGVECPLAHASLQKKKVGPL